MPCSSPPEKVGVLCVGRMLRESQGQPRILSPQTSRFSQPIHYLRSQALWLRIAVNAVCSEMYQVFSIAYEEAFGLQLKLGRLAEARI